MSRWTPLAVDGDDDTEPARFILDNDVDAELLHTMQGSGASVVPLPIPFRSRSDEQVLAEAKRQGRMLITHDRRFVDPRTIDPACNPGVIILPRGHDGSLDWPLVMSVLAHAVQSPYGIDQTVVQVFPSGRITIWNPDEHTGEMKPIFCRVTDMGVVEVWLDDDGFWADDPQY